MKSHLTNKGEKEAALLIQGKNVAEGRCSVASLQRTWRMWTRRLVLGEACREEACSESTLARDEGRRSTEDGGRRWSRSAKTVC